MIDLPIGVPLAIVLLVIAFVSGIGITTVGPGGVFVTIALYSLTPASSGTVAGTAHAAFIATGLVGTAAYVHSGEMRTGDARAMALVLSLSSTAGALVGTYVNSFVPRAVFGLLLGIIVMATGITMIYRERRDLSPVYQLTVADREGRAVLGVLGIALGVISGLSGVGGPVIAVPALIMLGVPVLPALAVAQVQSIFIAAFAATGYLVQGNVSTSLAALVGLPLLAGVVVGWKVAHLVEPARLKLVLGGVLIVVGPALAL